MAIVSQIFLSFPKVSEKPQKEERLTPHMAGSKLQAIWNHPAGPKTIFFWAPTVKWGMSMANILDFSKPPEMISHPQQVAVTCTGIIFSRYTMVITPKNWNLFGNSIFMAGTGLYQLTRKIKHDYMAEVTERTE